MNLDVLEGATVSPVYDIRLELVRTEVETFPKVNLTYSTTGFNIYLTRWLQPYVWNTYLPSGILVLISFISFAIPVEQVPGRMALIVTIFLMLVNISTSLKTTEPKARFQKCYWGYFNNFI